jgi:hypothetical protein
MSVSIGNDNRNRNRNRKGTGNGRASHTSSSTSSYIVGTSTELCPTYHLITGIHRIVYPFELLPAACKHIVAQYSIAAADTSARSTASTHARQPLQVKLLLDEYGDRIDISSSIPRHRIVLSFYSHLVRVASLLFSVRLSLRNFHYSTQISICCIFIINLDVINF